MSLLINDLSTAQDDETKENLTIGVLQTERKNILRASSMLATATDMAVKTEKNTYRTSLLKDIPRKRKKQLRSHQEIYIFHGTV